MGLLQNSVPKFVACGKFYIIHVAFIVYFVNRRFVFLVCETLGRNYFIKVMWLLRVSAGFFLLLLSWFSIFSGTPCWVIG